MSVTAVDGFRASGLASGIKASGAPDLAIVATTDGAPVTAAGVFTANLVAAAPVQISRRHLADGRAASAHIAAAEAPALILMDVMLPYLDGFELVALVRARPDWNGVPILMLTAADRLDDKASGFGLGADDYLTKPFELQELVLRLRALDRRRAHNRPPVREIAGLRLDPFRREVYRDGRYVALTRKQFAVLEVLVAAEGGVISAEELLERAWDENADPFTNAIRITVGTLRRKLGDPPLIETVTGSPPDHRPLVGALHARYAALYRL